MINGKFKIFKLNLNQEKIDQSKDDEFIPADIGGVGSGSTEKTNHGKNEADSERN